MKLNIHLNGFAMRKDLLTKKTKRQFLFSPEISVKMGQKKKITT